MTQTVNRPIYDNVLVLDKDNNKLSSTNNKRADWLVKTGSAIEIEAIAPHPRTIKLFKSNEGMIVLPCHHKFKEDKCVICGKTTELCVHHVVPYFIRKLFPLEYKTHGNQWCVCLCRNDHNKADELIFKAIPDFNQLIANKYIFRIKQLNAYRTLLKHGDKIPAAKKQYLFDTFGLNINLNKSTLKKGEKELKKILLNEKNDLIKQWINKHSMEELHIFFRDLFLQTNPKYLMDGALTFIPKLG